jgi:DNA-binding NtrC family response regulator
MNMRVLIVDDEPNLRTTLAEILEDEGYVVHTAMSGEAAVQLCASQEFDVLIMDMRMPGISGVEVLHKLRENGSKSRVILMSAYAVENVKREALRGGALAFMDKPLDLDGLLDLVRESNHAAVLMISEDPATLKLGRQLKTHGYRVMTADTPRRALELSQKIAFNIVLIDCEMPASSGLDTYLEIKRVAPRSDAIMLTGSDEVNKNVAREAVKHTAYTFVEKPVADSALPDILTQLIGQQLSGERAKPDSLG